MTAQVRTAGYAAGIAFGAIYLWCAAWTFQASRLASSLDIASLQRAIALEPRHAGYQDLLCRYLLFDRQDPTAALPSCERATQLNPYFSPYWLNLALAYYSVGQPQKQQEAILKAVAVDPTTPDVAWNAANFFLVQGNVSEALHQFATVMRNDPNRVRPALELCWRAMPEVTTIEGVLPPDPGVYVEFIRLLTARNEWAGAAQLWSGLLSLDKAPDDKQAMRYVDALMEHRDVARAQEVWQQLAARSPQLRARIRADDLVVNGGFEEPILNDGFDWRYGKQKGSTASLDTSEFHSGTRSISIFYNGRSDDSGLAQFVPVKPNTEYIVSAWTKSEVLKSGSGICLSVADGYDNNKVYDETPETLGTTTWHQVEGHFQTGPDTQLVILRFTHAHGELWVEGQFWADDVSLRPAAEPMPAR